MTDTDGPAYRSRFDGDPAAITLREADEVDDGDDMMEVRMAVASTGEVRNEGDDPLSADELRGMARQLDTGTVGIFLEHGTSNAVDAGMYSQLGKLGYWTEGSVESEAAADGEDLLMGTARMPDPEALPAQTGEYRTTLAIIKEQAKRGVPISASIGWRDDEDAPGGNDLMETSIVGIGADPRTTTEPGTEALARAAVDAGADPEAFVERVARIVTEDTHDMTDDDTASEEQDATTETEQDGGDAETTERAPEDVTEDDLLTFTARHFDGMDEGDLAEAVDAADAEYIGECDAEALFDFVSIVTGAEYGDVEDAMGELMTDEQGDYGDDEEEDDEDEQSSDDPEAEQSGDEPNEEQDADTSDLEARLAALEEELADVRAGETDVETPDHDDGDAEEERDADTDDDADDTDERTAESPAEGLGDYR